MNKKAAIEFSANVIVIIIISSVILALGLMLFFNLKGQAGKYTDTIEQQTQEQLKALMLNDNSKVAIYPNDLTIPAGKSQLTTVAVSNNLNEANRFESKELKNIVIMYYKTPQSEPKLITDDILTGSENTLNFMFINPGNQDFKNLLIKMPANSKKGQYVATIKIYNYTTTFCTTCEPYAIAKLYITVP
jgi:Tfp pilus assembly protein PilO